MTTFFPPKVSTQYIFYASLVSQANTKIMQVNPTIASGDFKVSIDGGALANLATLPTVTPAAGSMVKFTLSTSEMAGANATVVCSDAAGAEWCDATFNIQTTARQIDDLAYPATSGRSLAVDTAGGVTLADAVAHGGTLGSSTATFALSRFNVTSQTSNTTAITAVGNGTGSGIVATSGVGATGDGIQATAASTNGNGFANTGIGTGAGFKSTGGATGNGLQIIGGATSGDAILTSATSGHGATFAGTGTTKHGINATGGATTSHGINAAGGGVGHGINAVGGGSAASDGIRTSGGATSGIGLNCIGIGTTFPGIKAAGGATTSAGMNLVGGATSGDGLLISATSGHGINTTGAGTTKHGISASGGATTSDGIRATGGGAGHGLNIVAGATGNALRATTTAGDALSIVPTAGHGVNIAANGTSKHGIFSTGGTAGVSDGASFAAGTGGVDIRGNITGSLSGSVNNVTNQAMHAGTAQAGSVNTITLAAGASATNGTYDPGVVRITSGTGIGQSREIIDYNGTSKIATVDRDWRTNPDNTSVYEIGAHPNLFSTNEGLATGGAASTITLNSSASAIDNTYNGQVIVIRTGLGQDQSRIITGYVGATKVATVDSAWITNPDTTSGYMIYQTSRLIGVSLTSAYDFAKGTVPMTESYAALGATLTAVQALYGINQQLGQQSISGTTMTVKKRDQSTTAKTYTLNDATIPTAITEAS